MARSRVNTSADSELLAASRASEPSGKPSTDAELVDAGLEALVATRRSAAIDAAYAAYDRHPLDEPDAWGDLGSFRNAAGRG